MAFDFVPLKTSLILASVFALCDLSVLIADSPAVADIIALTSAPVFVITSRFKSLKSCNCSPVWFNVRSRSRISVNRDEHTHRRYVSFMVAQNWSMHVKYASRQALYPEPNVLEPAAAAVINAARDRRDD